MDTTKDFQISNLSPPLTRFDLMAGQYRAMAGKSHQTFYCLRGILWITQERDARDYILRKEDAFIVTQPGLVMVMALRTACIGFSESGLNFVPFKGRLGTAATRRLPNAF